MGLRAFAEVVNLLKVFGGIVDISRCSSITIIKKSKKNVLRYSCSASTSSSSSSSSRGWPRRFLSLVVHDTGVGREYCSFLSRSWLSAFKLVGTCVRRCEVSRCVGVDVYCRLRSYCCSPILYVVHSYSYIATLFLLLRWGGFG